MNNDDYKQRLKRLTTIYQEQVVNGDYFNFEGVTYYPNGCSTNRKDIYCDLSCDLLNWFLAPYENFIFKFLDVDNVMYNVVFLIKKQDDDVSWQMHEVQKNKNIKKYYMECRAIHIIRLFIQHQLSLTETKIKTVYAKN